STVSRSTRRSRSVLPDAVTSSTSSTAATSSGTPTSRRAAGSCRISRASSASAFRPYTERGDDLLRDPEGARGRALRQDGRGLQGHPEGDGDRRSADGARPAFREVVRRQAPAPRPPAQARAGNLPADGGARLTSRT